MLYLSFMPLSLALLFEAFFTHGSKLVQFTSPFPLPLKHFYPNSYQLFWKLVTLTAATLFWDIPLLPMAVSWNLLSNTDLILLNSECPNHFYMSTQSFSCLDLSPFWSTSLFLLLLHTPPPQNPTPTFALPPLSFSSTILIAAFSTIHQISQPYIWNSNCTKDLIFNFPPPIPPLFHSSFFYQSITCLF